MPEGTVVNDLYTGEVLAELLHHGDRWLAAAGGRGGRGNAKFLSNRRRAPSFAEQGEHGEERWLKLELQLMADVALVGFPNVGKSTLISVISAAKPKIADYPFTTLEPNLGVVRLDDATEFVVADIPGLIEGASEGAGLGHQFLRHVERARVLCLLVDLAALDGIAPGRAGARAARTSSATTGPSCSTGRGSSSARRPTSPARPIRRARLRARRRDAVRHLGRHRRRRRASWSAAMAARPRGPRRRRPSTEGVVLLRPEPTGAAVERVGDARVPGRGRDVERVVALNDITTPDAVAYISHRLERLGRQQAARPGRRRRRRRRVDRRLQLRVPGRLTCASSSRSGRRRSPTSGARSTTARSPSSAGEIAALRADGHEVVVVSSGAVAAGVAALGLDSPPDRHRHAAGARRRRPAPADAQLGRRARRPRPRAGPGAARARTTSSTAASTSTPAAR